MKKIATDFLYELLKIKSYDPVEKVRCANLIKSKLIELKFEVEVISEFGSPIVLAHLETGAESNILFYSHYDVKPEGNLKDWNTEPFTPFYNSNDNKIYARGAGDDKGQFFATIMGIESAIAIGEPLAYNITLLIEGDEESGSVGLEDFCKQKLYNKKYTAVIINDSHWLNDNPVIYCGTRGQQSVRILYNTTGMSENLHAGNYGGIEIGAARKFIIFLTKILHEIDGVINTYPTTKEIYANAVSLTNIFSGDTKRSTIPKSANAKIDIRFIDATIPQKVEDILIRAKEAYGIDYEIEQNEEDFYNAPDMPFIDKVQSIIRDVTIKEPLIKSYSGAYLPMHKLQHIVGTKYIIPFAQADEHNHAPNENISLDHISYGMDIIKYLII